MRPRASAALVAAVALSAVPGVALAQEPERVEDRRVALDAASAWRDSLESHRAPRLPTPGATESVILVLDGRGAAAAEPAKRAAAADAIARRQKRVERTLAGLGVTVNFRYRMLINGLGVRVPTGRLPAVAALADVRAVVPVSFLAPAQAGPATAPGGSAPTTVPAPAPPGPAPRVAATGAPAHIALIDAGVDVDHPWLGGGMGPTFPIVGGWDVVGVDDDPRPDPRDPDGEAHGTQMASLVLRSPALADLPPERFPRLVSYRVVAREAVEGRLRPLARSDRVLAALERAVDPDRDGDPGDRAEVILLGLATSFAGTGMDPVADAAAAADRLGASVVVPAGNDGPTFARPGSVGSLAAVPTAITVGGLSDGSARTAELEIMIGSARAALGPLPLSGPRPAGDPLVPVVLDGPEGLAAAGDPDSYRDAEGRSLVAGRLAVAAREGGTLQEAARAASDAGAAALLIWDREGPAAFPAVDGGQAFPIAVMGAGPRQGEALAGLLATQERVRAAVRVTDGPRPVATVASFSSTGPAPGGQAKPDLIAPAVDRVTAYPPVGAGGPPRTAALTGTSAAAADVAARALRLRVDRPALGPRQVHSLLLQAARPLAGQSALRQGAGVAGAPSPEAGLVFDPPIVTPTPRGDGSLLAVDIRNLGDGAGRYVVRLKTRAGTVRELDRIDLAPGEEVAVRAPVPFGPAAARGVVEVIAPSGGVEGRVAGGAMVEPTRAPEARDGLGVPEVVVRSGLAEVRLRLGRREREGARVRSVELSDLRLWLLPAGGERPLAVLGGKLAADWPAGTYRFLLADRLADGAEVPAGRYRLRASAAAPDGERVVTTSAPFELGSAEPEG